MTYNGVLLKQNQKSEKELQSRYFKAHIWKELNVLCCQVDIISQFFAKEIKKEIVIKRTNCKCSGVEKIK